MNKLLNRIFRSKNITTENITNNQSKDFEDDQFGKTTDKNVSELLKKATALKKTDIEQAIQLIKNALEIDSKYPCHDKLINYLIIANKLDEAEALIISLIDESKNDKSIISFHDRAGIYDVYANFLFKKMQYKDYIFYYSLSIYNGLVWDALNEQIINVKEQLRLLKSKEEFIDKKTNKSFQELNSSKNQDLYLKTYYNILKDFQFNKLYDLVYFLNNKQVDREQIEYEGVIKNTDDWKLWSNKLFCEIILKYDENIFIDIYKSKLEILFS